MSFGAKRLIGPAGAPLERSAMAYEGSITSLVKLRDEDGTVDRVPDPPQALWPVLACLRYKAMDNHIDLPSLFVVRQIRPSF